MHDVERLIDDAAFWVALVLSAVGYAVVWSRVRGGMGVPGPAVVAVVAGLVGLRVADRYSMLLVVGAALLVAGEALIRDGGSVARLVALLPGALVVGAALPDGWPFWTRAVASVVAAVGGIVIVATDRAMPRLVPALFAVSAIGVYFCVPDTEAAVVLVGALVTGSLFVFEPRLRAAIGIPALTGFLAWVAVDGGVGRAGAIVGGVACLGVLLLIPLVRVARSNTPGLARFVVVQVALVAYESRVAGAETSGWVALALSVPAFAIAAGVLLLVGRRSSTAS